MTFAAALATLAWSSPRARYPVLAASAAYVLGVGLSRVYLHAHFPADVAAGWCIALAWATALRVLWVALVPAKTSSGLRAGPNGRTPGPEAASTSTRPHRQSYQTSGLPPMSSHESTNGAFRSPRSTPLAPTINIRSTSGTFPHRIHGRVSWHRATRLQLRPEADLEPPDLNVADFGDRPVCDGRRHTCHKRGRRTA